MRLKVPFFGYVLAIIGLVLPSLVFAAILPALINAEPVKKRLMAELTSWTGSEIALNGPVTIENFFSLSVNLRNVEFKGIKGFPNLKMLRADEIVARVAWTDLLAGNLDFDKIKINDARAELTVMEGEHAFDALSALLAASNQIPFAAFALTNCEVTIEGAKDQGQLHIDAVTARLRQPSQRVAFGGNLKWRDETLSFDVSTYPALATPGVTPVPLKFSLTGKRLTASFDGRANLAGRWTGSGRFSVSAPNAEQLVSWLEMTPGSAVGQPASVSGTITSSDTGIALRGAEFSLAGEKASGDVDIGLDPQKLTIDGSLAFDEVDFHSLWAFSMSRGQASSDEPWAPIAWRAIQDADMDLRVSANKSRWSTLPLGATAFTLSAKAGQFSAEIADLSMLGGSVLGHVGIDLSGETARARARLTAEDVDAARVLALVSQPNWLAGNVDANIEAEAEGHTAGELFESAKANARVVFADGGDVRLDIPRLAKSASPADREGWDGIDFTQTHFDKLRAQLYLDERCLRVSDLEISSGNGIVRGFGDIDIAQQQLDWQMWVWSKAGSDAADSGAQTDVADAPVGGLSIRGPWQRPAIRVGEPLKKINEKSGAVGDAGVPNRKL